MWVGAITSVPTGEGWLSRAVLLDAHARRVIGWALADHLRTELALGAGASAPHRSGRPQYTAASYQQALARRGRICSMSRSSECLDNAMVERFFATRKAERIHTRA